MGEMCVDEEKQSLLQKQDERTSPGHVAIRESLTRWMLLCALLMNAYLWQLSLRACSLQPAEHAQLQFQGTKKWAHGAAEVAERVALYDCSGHGSVLVDTVQTNVNEIVCECHACFSGPSCADSIPNCAADLASGDPMLYEYFWKQNADAGTLAIPPWYRMSYFDNVGTATSAIEALEVQIRALHALVGNIAAEGKHLVISSGSTPLLEAIVVALASGSSNPTSLVAALPFYELYRRQANMFGFSGYSWEGDAKTYAQNASNAEKNSIEFVTYPNNPDFLTREPVLDRSTAHVVYDFAYCWPHMSPVNRTFDEDIMIFTLSKITGHAGSRLGWAFFTDPEFADRVRTVERTISLGVSRDIQARATKLLSAVLAAYSGDKGAVPLGLPAAEYAEQGRIFHYGRSVLQKRWEWIEATLNGSARFSFQKHEPDYCSFFGQTLKPSPAYAWIYCNREEDQDCYGLFADGGIVANPGAKYGVTNRYVRISLLKRDSDFERLAKYLPALAAA